MGMMRKRNPYAERITAIRRRLTLLGVALANPKATTRENTQLLAEALARRTRELADSIAQEPDNG
jgi:hypothetical protein